MMTDEVSVIVASIERIQDEYAVDRITESMNVVRLEQFGEELAWLWKIILWYIPGGIPGNAPLEVRCDAAWADYSAYYYELIGKYPKTFSKRDGQPLWQ